MASPQDDADGGCAVGAQKRERLHVSVRHSYATVDFRPTSVADEQHIMIHTLSVPWCKDHGVSIDSNRFSPVPLARNNRRNKELLRQMPSGADDPAAPARVPARDQSCSSQNAPQYAYTARLFPT